MKLEDIKNDIPCVPDNIHSMIVNEVEKQMRQDNVTRMVRKRNGANSLLRVATMVLVCLVGTSTVAYAGTRLYGFVLKNVGNYAVSSQISALSENKKIDVPKTIFALKANPEYIPSGMISDGANHYFREEQPDGGISIGYMLLDSESVDVELIEKDVVECEKRTFGGFDGYYLRYANIEDKTSYDKRIYLVYPEKYRIVEMYFGKDVTKADAIRFAENIKFVETDEVLETQYLLGWSDLVKTEDAHSKNSNMTEAGELPVLAIGDMFSPESVVTNESGKTVSTTGVSIKVENVKVADDFSLLNDKYISSELKAYADDTGKLKENKVSYVKSGDGVNSIDKVVGEGIVKPKLVYATVTYTNNTRYDLSNVLYCGTLWLLKQENSIYRIYDPKYEKGADYDYITGENPLLTRTMVYYSTKSDYGNGGNYISKIKAGESVTVDMAWIVTEDDLPNMYLNLNPSGGECEITSSDIKTGVVYIGR